MPIWLNYYRQFFSDDEIFIFDNGSSLAFKEQFLQGHNVFNVPDHYRDVLPGSRRFYRKPSFDSARAKLLSEFCNGLLAYFHRVIVVDVDEMLVAGPSFDFSLNRFLDENRDLKIGAALGLGLAQIPTREDECLDLSQPILGQRGFVHFDFRYSKPSIRSVKAMWGAGFHGCSKPFEICDDLYLFHLRDMDLDIRRENHARRHEGFLDHGKGQASSWKYNADGILAKHLARLDRSSFSGRCFSDVKHGYRVGEIRPGFFRVVPKSGTLVRPRRFRFHRVPSAFQGIF